MDSDIEEIKKKLFKDKSTISVSGHSEVIITLILKVITIKIRRDKPSSFPIYINTNWLNNNHPSEYPLTTLTRNVYELELSSLIDRKEEIILIVDGSGFLSEKLIYLFLKELAYLNKHDAIQLIFSNLETTLKSYQTLDYTRFFVE